MKMEMIRITTKKPTLQEQAMALELFSSDAFLSLNKKLLKQVGPNRAVFLCNLVDKYRYFKTNDMLREDEGFFLTHENQMEHTGMSLHQIRECKKYWSEKGVLKTYSKGVPAKEFYILNIDKLVAEFIRKDDEGVCIPLDLEKLEVYTSKNRRSIKENLSKENLSEKKKRRRGKKTSKEFFPKIKKSMFERFWELYPRKVDKGKAKTSWEKLCNKNNRPRWNEIESAIKKQAMTSRWENKKYIPYPTTWLNQQRWLDDPEEMNENSFKGSATKSNDSRPAKTAYSGPGPRQIIKNELKMLAPYFEQDCYRPALAYLNTSKSKADRVSLVENLIELYNDIEAAQDKNIPADLRRSFPGPMTVIGNYVDWLESNDWITNRNPQLFSSSHRLFGRYRREAAEADNMMRDPLTGESYL